MRRMPLAVIALALPSLCQGGAGNLYVTDRGKEACHLGEPDAETQVYVKTTAETIEALKRYFAGEPNPDLIDAVIVNAGIKFCGKAEKAAIREFVAAEKRKKGAPKRVSEVYGNYFRR